MATKSVSVRESSQPLKVSVRESSQPPHPALSLSENIRPSPPPPSSHGEDGCHQVQAGNQHSQLCQDDSQQESITGLPVEARPLEEPQKPDQIVIGDGLHQPGGSAGGGERERKMERGRVNDHN